VVEQGLLPFHFANISLEYRETLSIYAQSMIRDQTFWYSLCSWQLYGAMGYYLSIDVDDNYIYLAGLVRLHNRLPSSIFLDCARSALWGLAVLATKYRCPLASWNSGTGEYLVRRLRVTA
jgi:hypothetical protein